MSNKEVFEVMRKPSDAEKTLVYAKLYKEYAKRFSGYKFFAWFFYIFAIIIVCAIMDAESFDWVGITEIVMCIACGLMCQALHKSRASGPRFARDITTGNIKVIACSLVELTWVDHVSTDGVASSNLAIRVRFADNSIPNSLYDIDSCTGRCLQENNALQLMLVTNGETWRVIIAN